MTAKNKQRLDRVVQETELECLEANEAFCAAPTIQNKLRLLTAELRSATLQRSVCLIEGNQAHALRWTEAATKLSREHTAVAEALAVDRAVSLSGKAEVEDEISKRLTTV